MKQFTFRLLFILLAPVATAQPPAGYYNSAAGLTGDSLRAALHMIIDNHTGVSYASLWTHFQVTDKKSNNEVWDMYSDIPSGTPPYTFTFVSDQCGNYAGEGDCYNREHSFPKSWFGDVFPINTDLFHLYPTDGYVNGKRAAFPYGETNSPSWTSQNGSKLGPNSFPGYTGQVFEPIDEYKGDFARTYFYMLTRYMDVASGWSTPMVQGNDLSPWTVNLLLSWTTSDTVSQKEIDRNNAVYQIQQNRNPFIDNPEFARMIWDTTWNAGPGPNPSVVAYSYLRDRMVVQGGNLHLSGEISGQVLIFDSSGRMYTSLDAASIIALPILPKGLFIALWIKPGSRVVAKFLK